MKVVVTTPNLAEEDVYFVCGGIGRLRDVVRSSLVKITEILRFCYISDGIVDKKVLVCYNKK